MPSVIEVVGFILFVVYVVLPLIFRYSSAFQRQLVFLPYTSNLSPSFQKRPFLVVKYHLFFLIIVSLRWPIVLDYSRPELHGLRGARNFYIPTEPKVRVGVW